jgi:hypothetical protein
MDTDLAAPTEASPTRCSATTKGGEQCKAYALQGGETCLTHSRTPEERKQAAHRAAARSAEVRAGVVEEREDAVRSARLGLEARLAARLEEEADAVTSRLRELALSRDDSTALRGIQLWLERVHGRAVARTEEVATANPLVEAFAALDPEERRRMLRLAQPLPEQPDTASAGG